MPVFELSTSDSARRIAADVDIEGLFARADAARRNSYAPYSGFGVGAALLTRGGEVLTGANVENGSLGLTICAERSAVSRAVTEGYRDFVAIAVAGNPERGGALVSCGACLQVLAEFDREGQLLVVFPEGQLLQVSSLSDLMPVRFSLRED